MAKLSVSRKRLSMHDFWINNGFQFYMIIGLIVVIVYLSLFYYTGSTKKLDLIATDIKNLGSARQEILNFDKSFNRGNFDPLGQSFFTHLFYRVPKEESNPDLYNDKDFIDQLWVIKIYYRAYTLAVMLILMDVAFICIMSILYGPCKS